MNCYKAAKKIVETLSSKGFIAYFAGGWVRDHLLGRKADDIDIATNATVDQVMALFPKTIPVGINFSILIVVQDGIHAEVATFRKESDYEDGRRPGRIIHCGPEEDAKRRDFTINGMFYDPLTEKIYDFVGGKIDLEKKIIRAIGDPNHRFFEDRLRMIRACRYSARFGFPIEEQTQKAIIVHAPEIFPAVAIERVYDEFKKMTREHHLFDGLLLMHKFGLLKVIFKDFPLLSHEKLEKKLKALPQFPDETYPTIFLYELFDNLSLEKKLKLCKYLKVSNKELQCTEELEKWKSSLSASNYDLVHLYAQSESKLCQKIAAIYLQDISFLAFHKKKQAELNAHIDRLIAKTPLITSKDLMDLGMEPGIELGKALKRAEEICINYNLSSKQEVLQLLQSKNK